MALILLHQAFPYNYGMDLNVFCFVFVWFYLFKLVNLLSFLKHNSSIMGSLNKLLSTYFVPDLC